MKSSTHFVLTLAQQDIYFDQMRQPNNPLYNIGGYIRMGKIDVSRLIVAHQQLVESQQAFGIRICQLDAKVCQSIANDNDTSLALLDLSLEDDAVKAADDWLRQAFAVPFDIENQPLYRATLLKLSEHSYRYVVVAHHLMMDGWGFANLTEKLCEFYCDRPVEDTPQNQWSAIAGSDEKYQKSAKYQSDKAHWLGQRGLDSTGIFDPFYRIKADGSQQRKSRRETFAISFENIQRINQLCADLRCSVAQFYLALVSLYFYLLYGLDVLRVGVVVHNRRKHSEKSMLGVFSGINSMVVDLPQQADFTTLLHQIVQLQKKGLRHQRFPLGHVINGLSQQGFDGLPYDLVFNYLALDPRLNFAGIDGQMVYLSHEHEPHPLKMTLWEYPHTGQAEWQIDYSLAYFEPKEAQLMALRLDFLLQQVLSSPNQYLTDYQRLLPQELALMCDWHLAPVSDDVSVCLLQGDFERQVSLTPDAIAVSDGSYHLTYQLLNQQANFIARQLIAFGVKADDKVGVCLDRSYHLLVALLAIVKAGGAYVPLDPQYPAERLGFMLKDSAIDLVLTECEHQSQLSDLTAHYQKDNQQTAIWSLDKKLLDNDQPWDDFDKAVAIDTQPHHLAYVIYTSGSTGVPKAVQISHANVCAFLAWVKKTFNAKQMAKTLASTSINFDISIMELFAPLCFGAEVVIVKDILTLVDDPRAVSFINTVPSAAKVMVEQNMLPKSVQTMALGGEALSQSLLNQLLAQAHIEQVFNLYGPTEDTIYSTFKCYQQPINTPVVIGSVIDYGFAYVVNQEGQLQPDGLVGELYLTGPKVSRGYANNQPLTDERFIKDPFNRNNDYPVYKTGDRVRRLSNGELAFLGRDDQQVKIRGHRIEPAEIEYQLERYQSVKEAVVLAFCLPQQAAQLWAFVTLVDNSQAHQVVSQQLLTFAAQALPHYMLPSYVRVIDEMPLTLNGKIDKKQLLSKVEHQVDQLNKHSSVEFDNDTQRQLANIWCDILAIDIDSIAPKDRFFALGGHSLQAVKLLGQINRHFAIALKLEQIFANSSLQQMAALVANAQAAQSQNVDVINHLADFKPVAVGEKALLSYAQQSLWHSEQLKFSAGAYHMLAAFDVEGALDIELLTRAFIGLIERHHILRTQYHQVDGTCYQKVAVDFDFAIERHDLTSLDGDAVAAQVSQLLQRLANASFDLSQDLMIRACWLASSASSGVLLVCLHHIAADGWSIEIIASELSHYYHHLLHGKTDEVLPPLALQYIDYAKWQRQFLADSEHYHHQMDYWQQQLRDAPLLCSIPTDHPRKNRADAPLKVFNHWLGESLSGRIKLTADTLDVTPFMLFHGVLALLLSRYTHNDDIVIGTAVANRMDDNIAALIGCFVNLVALRVSTDFTDFDLYMSHVRQVNVEAQHHHNAPFEQVLQSLNVSRSDSYSPLFQVCLTLVDAELFQFELGAAGLTRRVEREAQAKFDLNVQARQVDGLWQLEWQYNAGLFDSWRIEAMAGHFANLMQQLLLTDGVCQQADEAEFIPLNQLCLLGPLEKQQLLVDFNQTYVPRVSGETLHGLIEQQCKAHPKTLAIVDGNQQIDYQTLNVKANQLAHLMVQQLSVTSANHIIAICAGRSIDAIIAIVASLKIGASYMMMDPSFPAARLAHMWQDAKADLFLCLTETQALCPQVPTELCLVLDSSECRTLCSSQPQHNMTIGFLPVGAYVIYTSGSTGKPKGGRCRHDSTLNLLHDLQDKKRVGVGDCGSLWANLGFDASVYEIFSQLCFGATLFIVPEPIRASLPQMLAFIKSHRLTNAFIPAFMLEGLQQAISANRDDFAFKRLLVGVEPILLSTLVEINRALPDVCIVNGYGPSEATICCVVYVVDANQGYESGQNTPIGGPIANSCALVLDQQLQLCPYGVVGELYLGGRPLGLGYLHQPMLTAQKFITNPFNSDEKLYRTGDLVRLTRDNQLEYVARADEQIKIRGFRVEPDEVARVLKTLDLIDDAVVLPIGEGSHKYLCGFAIPATTMHHSVLQRQLKAELEALLPDFMIPAQLIFVDEFPQLKNDKLDKQGLKALVKDNHQQALTLPSSELEQQLLQVWQKLLANQHIGVDQHFFELGGNSLLIAQLVHQLSTECDIHIQAKDLLTHATIAQLARFIEDQQQLPLLPLTAGHLSQAALSKSQYRVWLVEQIYPDTNQNNIAGGIKIEGQLAVELVKATLDHLVQLHPMLRAKLVICDGEPCQIIEPFEANAQSIALNIEDLTNMDGHLRLTHAESLIQTHGKSKALVGASILLLKLSAFEWRLHGNFHHLMLDGWSVSIFINDFIETYQLLASNLKPQLPSNSVTYLDYVTWQNNWLATALGQQSGEFWQQYLADVQTTLDLSFLAVDGDDNDDAVSGRVELLTLVDSNTWQGLCELAAKTRCSHFQLTFSVMALLLGRLSGCDDLNIGVASAGRELAGVERLIGNFVNNLPIRSQLALDCGFDAWLLKQSEQIQQALNHSLLPYEYIAKAAGSEGKPLFDVFFNWLELPSTQLSNDCFTSEFDIAPEIAVKFAIAFYVKQTADSGLSISCHFDHTRFSADKIRWLLHVYAQLLTDISAAPTLACIDYSLALQRGSQTIAKPAKTVDWQGPVHQQLAQFADAAALCCDNTTMSYRQLDALSDNVAMQLVARGVKPADVVAIESERNSHLIVNIFGCLKAAGVFVLLDNRWPQSLIDQRLAICKPKQRLKCVHYDDDVDAVLPTVEFTADTPAYLAFTSGSEGEAKLVKGTHGSLNAYIPWMAEHFGFDANQGFAMLSGLTHDPLLRDIFTPLALGACLFIPTFSQLQPIEITDFLLKHPIAVVNLTPSLAEFLLQGVEHVFSDLQTVIFGGEKLEKSTVKLIETLAPKAQIASFYGATETARALCCLSDISSDNWDEDHKLGEGIADVGVQVLNAKLQRCAPAEVGQIAIGSHYLPLGYANDQALSRQKFIEDNDQRWYLTGDLGRYLLDGSISFIGRGDDQLNVRGIRVEAGEISAILNRHDAVERTLVKLLDDKLVVFVASSQPALESEFKSLLQQHLPGYLQPQLLVVLTQLPLTVNGKVDHQALALIAEQQVNHYQQRRLLPPQSAVEQQLFDWWQQLLQRQDISTDEGFFDLGGHSLLASRLLVRIKRHYQVSPSFQQLFSHNTIVRLASLIEQLQLAAKLTKSTQTAASQKQRKKVSI